MRPSLLIVILSLIFTNSWGAFPKRSGNEKKTVSQEMPLPKKKSVESEIQSEDISQAPIALDDSDATAVASEPTVDLKEQAFPSEDPKSAAAVNTPVPTTPTVSDRLPAISNVDTQIKKESEIPVFQKPSEKKEKSMGTGLRLALSFLVLALCGVGGFFLSKWLKTKSFKTQDNNRVRILNQHHLGQRKSLVTIRVSGETLLLGVTDHSINLIKTLSLIEDEESAPSFHDRLDANATEDEIVDAPEPAYHDVKDRVSKRIREMRNI